MTRFLACLTLGIVLAHPALACGGPPVCTVVDPTGTPLNVRAAPKGAILSVLKNGQQVEIIDHQTAGDQTWARIARFEADNPLPYDGAWVFAAYLNCAKGLSALPASPDWSSDRTVACTVTDPTGTPLNVRGDPGGEIWGSVGNGTKLRAMAVAQHNGKDWAYVSQGSEDKVVGWVYVPYLACDEDGGH
jgi:hypothetical protein